MLSREDNERLTRVGAGSSMGQLLRRYWHPVAAVAELADKPVKAIRLFGEDLVLFQDKSGRYGLIDRRCPHRGFDLSYGTVEEKGLRCSYHGWRFCSGGRCLEQPFEDTVNPAARFKDKISMTAYPVKAQAGLLWVYMGPDPVPPLPLWEPFSWDRGFVHVFFAEVPCNWFQCQENSIDPVHFEWLHMNWLNQQHGDGTEEPPPKHLKVGFREFDYGFQYGRVMEGSSEEDEAWTIGRVCLWPNALYTGLNFSWRVPIDEERTLAVDWAYTPVPADKLPFSQERIPYSYLPLQATDGRWLVGDIVHQDLVALVAQGTIADRTAEHLGASDEGIILMRRKFFAEMKRLEESGGEPFALPMKEGVCRLPFMGRNYLLENRPARKEGFDAVQRQVFQKHVISGLSEETLQAWTEVFGEPPSFHCDID